jgi:formate/nitrite transporter
MALLRELERRSKRVPRRTPMDYNKPADLVANMIEAGRMKLGLPVRDLLIRGIIAGAILATATSLAFTGALSTGQPLVGALIFPVGVILIALLGLELLTGSFALLPLAHLEHGISRERILANWGWVFLGNLIGSVAYGILLIVSLTKMGALEPTGIAAQIVKVAEAKTNGYAALGAAGMVTVFVNGILCNWLVSLGVIMAMSSTSTIGKIVAVWIPIFIFFAQGFEHTVVNMFLIPTGMILGAKVTVADWWLWNQIPVTLGNLVGGCLFTGLALYLAHKPKPVAKPAASAPPMAAE